MTFDLAMYRLATALARPFLPAYLRRRARRGKEVEARLGERWGRSALPRPHGKLAWVHGASLGESKMMLPVVRELVAREWSVVMTTQTVSAAEVMAGKLPEGAVHQFAPLDAGAAVRRFLDHWRPDAVLFAESELWPNMLREVRRRDISAALVNARMNADSLARWGKREGSFREIMGAFSIVLPADAATRVGLESLLKRELPDAENLKFAGVPTVDEAVVRELHDEVGEGPFWCAANVHPEEMEAVRAYAEGVQGARCVWLPRYPDRMAEYGFRTDDVVVARFGVAGEVYSLCDWVLMCGSFDAELKGHNPLEPAHLGRPVATGPHVASFADVYADYHDAMAATQGELLERAKRWSTDARELTETAERAEAFASAKAGVLARVMGRLAPVLGA